MSLWRKYPSRLLALNGFLPAKWLLVVTLVGVSAAAIAAAPIATVRVGSERARSEHDAKPIKKVGADNSAVTANPRGTGDRFVAQACCAAGNGWAPGEPSIAVGKSSIVETVNSSLTVYAKGASPPAELFHQDLTSFFGGGRIACVDPRVIYWSWSDRYALVCSDIGSSPAVVRFAVTTGSDPSGSWNKYVINSGFLDQPKIEATADKLIIAGTGDNTTTQFYVYQLSDILAGASTPAVAHLIGTGSGLYQAAVQYSPTRPGYFVSAYGCATCRVLLATISGTPATSVSLTETDLGEPRLTPTVDPPVPAGTLGGAMDTRVLTAAYEVETSDNQPVIRYSTNTGCTLDGVPTVCAAIGKITWKGSTPVLGGVDIEGRANAAYTFGALTLDEFGRVYVAHSLSSPTSMPAAALLGPLVQTQHPPDTVIQAPPAGTTACNPGDVAPCDERWGDYMGATQDPTDPKYVWLAGLYQASSAPFGWATVIARAHVGGLG
jgi:hypothetical protein